MAKIYQNRSTSEPRYSDINLTSKIESLNPCEQCGYFEIFNCRPIVKYKVDEINNYKIDFAKYR